MGSSQVFAMIDPQSATAQNLLNSRGYSLVLMHQDDEDAYWQLFNPQADPCFPQSQRIQFIVVLSTPQHKVPAAVMPGTEVGRRVKAGCCSAPARRNSAPVSKPATAPV